MGCCMGCCGLVLSSQTPRIDRFSLVKLSPEVLVSICWSSTGFPVSVAPAVAPVFAAETGVALISHRSGPSNHRPLLLLLAEEREEPRRHDGRPVGRHAGLVHGV